MVAEMVNPTAGVPAFPGEGISNGCDCMHPGPKLRQAEAGLNSPMISFTGSRKKAHI